MAQPLCRCRSQPSRRAGILFRYMRFRFFTYALEVASAHARQLFDSENDQWVLNHIYECGLNEVATRNSSEVLTVGSFPDDMEPYIHRCRRMCTAGVRSHHMKTLAIVTNLTKTHINRPCQPDRGWSPVVDEPGSRSSFKPRTKVTSQRQK
jgi:hypothetical protein